MAPPVSSKRTPDAVRRLRNNVISTFTATRDWLANNATVKTTRSLKLRISNMEEKYAEFVALTEELLIEDDSDNNDAAQVSVSTDDLYLSVRADLESELDRLEPGDDRQSQAGSEYGSCHSSRKQDSVSVRLPKRELPTFDGKKPEEWPSFYQRFTTALRHPNINDLERFEYLVGCIKEPAFDRIRNIPLLESNYEFALKKLRLRFENKRLNLRLHLAKLFQLPAVTENDASSLRTLIDIMTSNIRALENLDLKRDSFSNELLVQLIVSKLDRKSRELWETTLSDVPDDEEENTELDSFTELVDFLERRLRVISSVFVATPVKSELTTKPQRNRAAALVSTTTTSAPVSSAPPSASSAPPSSTPTQVRQPCPCCDKLHALYQCEEFRKLPVSDRYAKVRDLKACVNCFSNTHWSKQCKSTTCKICGKLHHTLLHPPNPSSPVAGSTTSAAAVSAAVSATPPPATSPVVTALASKPSGGVLLATAIVNVITEKTTSTATVLLDGGSHVSLITNRLQKKVQSSVASVNTKLTGVGSSTLLIKNRTELVIAAQSGTSQFKISGLLVDHITDPLPNQSFDVSSTADWGFLANYTLADPAFSIRKDIDILIGADILYDILLPEIIKNRNGPTLQASHLGWLLTGPYTISTHQHEARCFKTTLAPIELREISRFLGLDDEPPRDKEKRSVDEIECERMFEATYQRDPLSGRFIIKLPMRKTKTIGESRQLALARLKRTRITDDYQKFLREYESLGHMSRCDPPLPQEVTYYIPHHAVYHDEKIRVVFDASMKSSNGISLNDCLLIGPTLQPSVHQILLHFRTFEHAFTTDISKMYRQILVAVEDRNLQRIVWVDEDGKIVDFCLNTVTYGTGAAPYLAVRCIVQLAKDGQTQFPAAAAALLQDTYMDDVHTGADTPEEVKQLQTELIALLQTAGMELGKWQFSGEPDSSRDLRNGSSGRALGVEWNTASDSFRFSALAGLCQAPTPISKRSALSKVSSIFDPLGLLAPITIAGKLLIQALWIGETGWDDPIPENIRIRFEEFFSGAACAAGLSFARFISNSRTGSIELHGFADASKDAYAACIFAKFTRENQPLIVRLVAAKTRVAPQRQPRTIPELELCAAALLAEFLPSVAAALRIDCPWYAYSDSTIVLAYLAKDAGAWTPYIANRVRKVAAVIPSHRWSHVPGEENPADLATRERSFNEFSARLSLWQTGPEFLKQPDAYSPRSLLSVATAESIATATAAVHLLSAAPNNSTNLPTSIVNYIISICSEYSRARGIIVALLRVKVYLLSKVRGLTPPTGEFTPVEFQCAELLMVREAQQDEYLPRRKLKALAPFLKDGVLRVGGRISRADVSYNHRHPIILPVAHRLTQLMARHFHYQYFHAGPQFIENFFRRTYWPIGNLSALISKCARTCARCARFKRNAKQIPPMADLPESRVRPAEPFSQVGVDYAGPFIRKPEIRTRSATQLKTYVAVFVCFVTKAVHLEAVNDLTTAAFLGALKRFVSRRGLPHTIYSDNGTNFSGAAREINNKFNDLARSTTIRNYTTTQSITWKFNPPSAPHMGGLWEAAVRVMKSHLVRTIGATLLTADEFSTVLCQIEAIMNSRPLTPLSPLIPDALTPGHFLIGRPLISLPDDFTEHSSNLKKRWDLVNQLRNQFWRRWRAEYLTTLQRRVKWTDSARAYQIGDVVLIADTDSAPLSWPLARVERVYPGADGSIRVVDVVTRGGSIFRRPVVKLIPLVEMDEEVSTSNDPSTAAEC